MDSLTNKKILFVFPSLELGGAERQGLVLAEHLAAREQAQVEIWGLSGGQRVVDVCKDFSILTREVPFSIWTMRSKLALQLIRFAKKIRDQKFDIILPYVTQPNLVCYSIWQWTRAQACIWQQRDEGKDRGPSRLEQRAARMASGFISNSPGGVSFLTENMGIARERVHVVPNGIQLKSPIDDRRTWRGRLEISERELIATMVANLTTAKDHETLLRAWRIVIDSIHQPVVLVLAGRLDEGADRAKSLAFDLDLRDRVRFVGPVNDVAGLLHASDICVYSSVREGCPNGVLEGMAAGLPVVGTDIRGIRQAVGKDNFRFLAPASDAGALAQRIKELLQSPDLRDSFGTRNQQRIEAEFSPEQMCRSTVDLICQSAKRSKS